MDLCPPVIVEGLSVCSKSIRLRGQLTGATVRAFVNTSGSPIVEEVASWADEWFPLMPTTALSGGDVVRVTQSKDGITSAFCTEGVAVQNASVTPPVIEAPVVACAPVVVVNALAPGAHVEVFKSGASIGSIDQASSRVVMPLSISLGVGETLTGSSTGCGGTAGPIVRSLPAESMERDGASLEIPTADAAYQCQRILHFQRLRLGCTLTVTRADHTSQKFTCDSHELYAHLNAPLKRRERVTFVLEPPATGCTAVASGQGITTARFLQELAPPLFGSDICPGSGWLRMSGLVPGATVKVQVDDQDVLVFEAAETNQDVDLGAFHLATGQRLTATQGLCDRFSPPSGLPVIVSSPPSPGTVTVVQPLNESATVVRVDGVPGGSRVSVVSTSLAGRIGFAYAESSAAVEVGVSPPLIAGDTVLAVVEGCHSATASSNVQQASELTAPTVVPPHAGDTSVIVTGIVPGSRVDIIVDDHWTGGADVPGTQARIGLDRPLIEGHRVVAVARLLGRSTRGTPATVLPDVVLTWRRPTRGALQNEFGHFKAGRVMAALQVKSDLILGTEEAGLWLSRPNRPPTPLSSGSSMVGIRCLATVPAGHLALAGAPVQTYAGTTEGLLETDLTATLPWYSWAPVSGLGVPNGPGKYVQDVLIIGSKAMIVLATTTGIWWSPLSADPSGHVWSTSPLVSKKNAISLCRVQNHAGGTTTPGVLAYAVDANGRAGFYVATWSALGDALHWIPTTPGVAVVAADPMAAQVAARMRNGHLSSCDSEPQRVYAAVSDPADDTVLAVLRSDDGGRTWALPYRDPQLKQFKPNGGFVDMGFQAWRNLRVLAHAHDPDTVILAARRGGVLGSPDGGRTWDSTAWPTITDGTFHADCLCAVADPHDPTGNSIIVGSDGGVFLSSDFGRHWDSSRNESFPTLMFQRGYEGMGSQSFTPSLSASSRFRGLVVGSFQDNGKGFLAGDGEPWRRLDSVGDGEMACFVTPDIVMSSGNDAVGVVNVARWNGYEFVDEIALTEPGAGPPRPFKPIASRVVRPIYTLPGSSAPMVALLSDQIASGSPSAQIIGVFDRGPGFASLADRLHLGLLAQVPLTMTGIGSFDGSRVIFAGNNAANESALFVLDTATQRRAQMLVPDDVVSNIRQICCLGRTSAVALSGNDLFVTHDMQTWSSVPTPATDTSTVNALAADVDVDPPRLILGGSDGVWSSRTFGSDWTPSRDAPRHPQATTMEVVTYDTAHRTVHMGTWNWSLWRAGLTEASVHDEEESDPVKLIGIRALILLVLAGLSTALVILTLVWKDWIEIVFNVDPDGGDGTAEWWIVGSFAAVAVLFVVAARWELRRLASNSPPV